MKGIQGDPRGSTNPANSNEDILLRGGGGGEGEITVVELRRKKQ